MLEVPEEICEKFDDAEAYAECMKTSIKSWFGYKRAAYFAKRKIQCHREAWDMVKAIYPDVNTGGWTYYPSEKCVRATES